MDNETLAQGTVRLYVWSGFYDADEIAEIVEECVFGSGDVDRRWLRELISAEFAKKRAAEVTWPRTTDCDRLDRVFELLEKEGILALQNAGYTLSDGISDINQFYAEAGGEESHITGYCFYHGQDLEGVIDRGELCLAYGDIDDDDQKGVEVGRRIKRALEASGFTVEWDGSIKTRLLVKGIKWQRREAEA
jgi:hypothetical protein